MSGAISSREIAMTGAPNLSRASSVRPAIRQPF
jgi:hypothetical protein